MLSLIEKRDLITQFTQLALAFSSYNHPDYGQYFQAWFFKGEGRKYEKFILQFNKDLTNCLVEYKAERSFKEAIYGEFEYKADGTRNWFQESGLLVGQTFLLQDFFDNYPEIARFFQGQFLEKFSLFLEINRELQVFA